MKTVIKNISIVSPGKKTISHGCIAIDGEIITYAGEHQEIRGECVIDGEGGIALPGFVNAHTHSPMTLLRNYADGYNLHDWLHNYIFPIEEKLTREDIYWGSMLAIMEMLASGTTLFADMYDFMEQVAMAVDQSGIKAHLSRGLICFDDDEDFASNKRYAAAQDLVRNVHDSAGGRIKAGFAPHAVYTTTPGFLKFIGEKAQEHGVLVHTHLSETIKENEDCIALHGKSPTRLMYDCGIFNNKTIAAHCVHMSQEDLLLLKEKNVTPVHNPSSNLKLGSGVAPLHDFLTSGLIPALGTDGTASNNNLNIVEEMHIAALLHNGVHMDPTLVQAEDVVKMAVNANALGFDDCGALESGKKADIVILSTKLPHCRPMHNAQSHLVYSASGADVSHVFVDGKLLYQHGEYKTIDSEKVYYNIKQCCKRLFGM